MQSSRFAKAPKHIDRHGRPRAYARSLRSLSTYPCAPVIFALVRTKRTRTHERIQHMTSSDIIATCSVLVAVLAFIATAWQAWLAHRHNRLSVRPLLVWHIGRYNGQSSSGITYSVKNLGLGPAIIRDRFFTIDRNRFKPPATSTDEVSTFLESILARGVEYHLKSFGLPGKDAAIPSQAEVVIADINFPALSPSQLGTVEEMAGDIGFHIRYESLYGESFDFKVVGKSAA